MASPMGLAIKKVSRGLNRDVMASGNNWFLPLQEPACAIYGEWQELVLATILFNIFLSFKWQELILATASTGSCHLKRGIRWAEW